MKREMADTPEDVETQEIVHRMERTACKINVAHRLAELGRMT